MKALFTILALITLFGCNNSNVSVSKNNNPKSLTTNESSPISKEGFKLMKQNCYVCHMPQSKETMIAPPLIRVKEHYLPVYKTKSVFSDAIVNWALNPSEEKALMPGAVRKFECMPPQAHIPKETLAKIAEYIFDNEMEIPDFFNSMHGKNQQRMGMRDGKNSQEELSKGRKWKVDKDVIKTITEVNEMIEAFKGERVEDYQKFGADIFSNTKQILLNRNNEGEVWDQLHVFFNKIEYDMHSLMSVKSIEKGKGIISRIRKKINNFSNNFE